MFGGTGSDDDLEIELTGHGKATDDVGDGPEPGRHVGERFGRSHAEADDGGDGEFDLGPVEQDARTTDDAIGAEALHSGVDGGCGDVEFLGDLGEGEASVLREISDDLLVKSVHRNKINGRTLM